MVKYLLLAIAAAAAACTTNQPSPPAQEKVVMAAAAPTVAGAAVNGPTAYWSYVNVESQKLTFAAQISQSALNSTQNLGVQGSPTKIVKITHVQVGPCTSTDGGLQDINFRLFTGFSGTDAAAYFLAQGYGFAADAGQSSTAHYIFAVSGFDHLTLTAALRAGALFSMPTVVLGTISATTPAVTWDFCRGAEMCPTIIGTDQIAIISVGTTNALAGQKCDQEIDWTEE